MSKYGLRELILGMLVLLALTAGMIYAAQWTPLLWALVPVPVVVLVWLVWFFRDPERPIPDEPGLFVSPADGRVTDVTRIGPDSPLGTDGVLIGVFMSIFDVHVNRMPAAGTVRKVEHRRGVFLDARNPLSSERNESATIYLTVHHDGQDYPAVLRQVAGFVARRIVTDLREGQAVGRGERIGMIKFGSRCEWLLPEALARQVHVRPGDVVRAGRSILMAATEETPPNDPT